MFCFCTAFFLFFFFFFGSRGLPGIFFRPYEGPWISFTPFFSSLWGFLRPVVSPLFLTAKFVVRFLMTPSDDVAFVPPFSLQASSSVFYVSLFVNG